MTEIPNIVKRAPLADLTRIDVALEGKWSQTVTAVWTREDGFIGFSKVEKSHRTFRPSIELYFPGFWIGVHCFRRNRGKNVFDEKLSMAIINFVNEKL